MIGMNARAALDDATRVAKQPQSRQDNARQVVKTTMWERADDIPWQRDLLVLFVRNQLRVAAVLPVLALVFAATSLAWTSWVSCAIWFACALLSQCAQLYVCRLHQTQHKESGLSINEWIGMLAASEFLYATCWALPLYLFWQTGNIFQHTFLFASLMVIIAIRIMIASNFMPVVIAGTGFIAVNMLARCAIEAGPYYIAIGAMIIVVEVFFIHLARRLQSNARDMLIFKSQREELITELQTAKDQAESARSRAEEANRAKSRFLATMSHELRTPLNAIMGFSEILSHEMMGPHAVSAYKDYSSDIHHSGHYLLNLINDILDLSRIEAGRREILDEPVSVSKEALDSIKLVNFKAKEKQQTIATDFPPDLPPLSGDRRSVRQIWLNLLSNAVKFTPSKGHIELTAKREPVGDISITVRDNGPGMTDEDVEIALNAFSRGKMATKKAIDGAGLGLSIVNGLARLHGGDLQIKSEVGKGTQVTVTFPQRRVLDSLRAESLGSGAVTSETQRRLISVTA
jgi:two-component system cell cycle sensor histidine kinase PleC